MTVGVIGCGMIARFHFEGLAAAGARVKWICDLNEAAAAPHVARFGAAYTADYRRILDDPEVQAVFILTFSPSHKELCLAAIAAGKAVVCEKTLATNADDALAIVRAAEAKPTIFYTAYMKRFLPAVQKAKELLPAIGPLVSTHIRVRQPWGDVWSAMPAKGMLHTPAGGRSQLVEKLGGGILVAGGSHILDLVCHFLGRPQRVHALMHQPAPRDYDLLTTAHFDTANGPCLFEALMSPLTRTGFLRDGWDERLELTGTRGRLKVFSPMWNQLDQKPSLVVHYDEASGAETEHRFPPTSAFTQEVAFFLDQVARGEQGPQSRRTGYDVDELIAHMTRSAQTGQALDLNWRI